MSYLIGIATWNFQERTLAERIERFARMGFNAVSLLAGDAAVMCRGETPDVEEAILRLNLGVAIHGGLAQGGKPIDEVALLADFEAFTRWHTRTRALRTVNYDAASARDQDRNVVYHAEAMASALRWMLDVSNGAGFTVGVEDWPRTDEQLMDVADLCDISHYGILIDLGHMNMRIRGANDSPLEFPVQNAQMYLDNIKLPVNELHIHNNDGAHDLHAPPTVGSADMRVLASMLKPKCPGCVSTIEIVPRFCGITEQEGIDASAQALELWKAIF